MSAMFSSVLVENPNLIQVSATGRQWYQDRDGQEYYSCVKCEKLTPEHLLTADYLCPECYDLTHTCAGCGAESEKELTSGKDGYYYCGGCLQEVFEARIKGVVKNLRTLQVKLTTEPEIIKADCPNDYIGQSGQAFGVMNFTAREIAGLISELEGK